MKNTKSLINYLLLFSIVVISFSQCTKITDNDLINPNLPSPDQADVDLFLNRIQADFTGFYYLAHIPTARLTRQLDFFYRSYSSSFQPTDLDGIWAVAYKALINIQTALPLAQNSQKFRHVGIMLTMRAYIAATMVDLFGDVPYTEALKGSDNLTPARSSSVDIYLAARTDLDSAIANFAKTVTTANLPQSDLFYSGNATNWSTLARTLQFKLAMQTRLIPGVAAQIAPLIAAYEAGSFNLIDLTSEDFNFPFGRNISLPDSRHPFYVSEYPAATSGAPTYLGNFYMYMLVFEKRAKAMNQTSGGTWEESTVSVPSTTDSFDDPRRRYMLYRQKTTYGDVDENTASCSIEPKPGHYGDYDPFCLPGGPSGRGYWGRDYGDNSGTPPDGPYRTAAGLYPVGGRFDNNDGARALSTGANIGAGGAGVFPIWNSEFTHFLLAEYFLTAGNDATKARNYLKNAITNSINKIQDFATAIGYTLPTTDTNRLLNTTDRKNLYINIVLDLFDKAATLDDKLDVVMKEYYIASWGNGIEAYNNYRRTSKPSNMQPLKLLPTEAGNYYIRLLPYPAVYIFRNASYNPDTDARRPGILSQQGFWDTNGPLSVK